MITEPPVEIVSHVPENAIPLREEGGEWVRMTREEWHASVRARREAAQERGR